MWFLFGSLSSKIALFFCDFSSVQYYYTFLLREMTLVWMLMGFISISISIFSLSISIQFSLNQLLLDIMYTLFSLPLTHSPHVQQFSIFIIVHAIVSNHVSIKLAVLGNMVTNMDIHLNCIRLEFTGSSYTCFLIVGSIRRFYVFKSIESKVHIIII